MVGVSAKQAQANWHAAVAGKSANYGYGSTAHRYEVLREEYVNDRIDLETFAAGVVLLLREGL